MKDEHIIKILDGTPLSRLSVEQLELVRSHSRNCVSCASAYRAFSVASAVIKERAQVVVEPTPFFQTKVLAALRERQALENVPGIFEALEIRRSARGFDGSNNCGSRGFEFYGTAGSRTCC